MEGEYAVKVSVRNALILRRMKALGIKSQTELARLAGISLSQVNALITLRRAPKRHSDGEWVDDAFSLSSALQIEPEELWTEKQRGMALRRNSYEVNMNEEEVQRLTTNGGVERLAIDKERSKIINAALLKLTPREELAVRRRFYEGDTLEEIANDWGVIRERVRQIEGKALRKLRHPSRGLEKYNEEQEYE